MDHRLTPIMGWASWNCFRTGITDELIKDQADLLLSTGLADCGYTFVNIDDGYFGGRDAGGRIAFHKDRFPFGIRPVSDYIHHLGLKAGIYTDAGDNTCGHYYDREGTNGLGVGLYGHEDQDLHQLLVEEDFDFIKVDWCGGNRLGLDEEDQYTKIGSLIHQIREETGKDILYNVCRWRFPGPWVAKVADSWRTGADICPTFSSILHQLDMVKPLARYCSPGHVNDLDMMQVGNGMGHEEEAAHFAMWCMMGTPLMIGCDLRFVSAASLDILKNRELIRLNQDKACRQAYVIRQYLDGDSVMAEIWLKELENPQEKAVAFLNRSREVMDLSVSFAEAGFTGRVLTSKELVYGEGITYSRDAAGNSGISCVVPPHGARVYRIRAEGTVHVVDAADAGEFTWSEDIYLDKEECEALLREGAVLVDVRTPEEYQASHMLGALNLPYLDLHSLGSEYKPLKGKQVILTCSSGKRCSQAKKTLEYLGYQELFLYRIDDGRK